MDVIVTDHAFERMKERMGLNKKAAKRLANKAYEKGATHAELAGRLNRWVTGQFLYSMKANNIRIYGDFAYIFCGEVLVTVIEVPKRIMSKARGKGKR